MTVPRALRATLQDVDSSVTTALLDSSPKFLGLSLAIPALRDGTRIAKISHSARRVPQAVMLRTLVPQSV